MFIHCKLMKTGLTTPFLSGTLYADAVLNSGRHQVMVQGSKHFEKNAVNRKLYTR